MPVTDGEKSWQHQRIAMLFPQEYHDTLGPSHQSVGPIYSTEAYFLESRPISLQRTVSQSE
jgi:hypothetical protein